MVKELARDSCRTSTIADTHACSGPQAMGTSMSTRPKLIRNRQRAHRWVAFVAIGALVLSACTDVATSKAGISTLADTALVKDGKVDLQAVESLLTEVAALDGLERQSRAASLDVELGRLVRKATGIDVELGGPENADEIFAAHGAALLEKVRAAAASTDPATAGGGETAMARRAGESPNIGEGMFGGLMAAILIPEGAVSATNTTSIDGTKSIPSGTLTADAEYVGVTHNFTYTNKGTTTTLKTNFELTPCPDADGKFSAHGKLDVTVTTASGARASGVLDVHAFGLVGEDAQLVSSDLDFTMSEASATGSIATVSGAVGDTVTTRMEYKSGGGANDAIGQGTTALGLIYALMVKQSLVDAAKKGWESGRCVTLNATTQPGKRTGLEPSASLKLTAAPHSKVDGAPSGGTVTATLNGSTSVDPSGSKVKADATFTVVAPGKKNQMATVALEARSRRGVGKAEVSVDTKAGSYTASGKQGNISFKGTVADLTEPFTINGTGGAKLTFSYTPSSADGRSGRMTYAGTVGGFKLSGSGNYIVTGDEGAVLVLTQGSKGCSAGPKSCIGGVARITLTPTG